MNLESTGTEDIELSVSNPVVGNLKVGGDFAGR